MTTPLHDEVVRLVGMAARIEHAFAIRYLYAAWSIPGDTGFGREARTAFLALAREEMAHQLTVLNVARLLGAPLDLGRMAGLGEDEPDGGVFLEPVDRAAVARFAVAEMPRDVARMPPDVLAAAGIGAGAPTRRVGLVYERLLSLLRQLPEDVVSAHAPAYRGTGEEWAGMNVPSVGTIAEAVRAIEHITWEGEGLDEHDGVTSHCERLIALFRAWPPELRAAPLPRFRGDGRPVEVVDAPRALAWMALFDHHYRLLVHALAHALVTPRDTEARRYLVDIALVEMRAALGPLAGWITRLPRRAGGDADEVAGPAFRLPPTFALPDLDDDRWRTLDRLLDEGATHAEAARRQEPPGVGRDLLDELDRVDASRRRAREGARPRPAPDPATVVVVGAGPAGLAAAAALARRGLPVRLLEAAPRVGGKVVSFREDGRSHEHGVHGWWRNYLNFDELMRWAGVDPRVALKEAFSSELVLAEGGRWTAEVWKRSLPSPLYLALQVVRAPYLGLRELVGGARAFVHILAFDHARDYARYDRISFATLLDRTSTSRRIRDRLLETFVLSFDFTTSDRVSAACVLSGLQFYVVHDQPSIATRWARGLPADVVFDPIVARLREAGVEVATGVRVERVRIEQDEVCGVDVRRAEAGGARLRRPAPTLGDGEWQRDGAAAVWLGRGAGAPRALRDRCPHMGCPVDWEPAAGRFRCPCHGSEFEPDGRVVRGPATAPMEALAVREDGADWVIEGLEEAERLAARDVIVATDVHAAARLLAGSDGVPDELRSRVAGLGTTPVVVVRLWYPPEVIIERPVETALTPGFAFIDNFFDLSTITPDLLRTEGRVIEVQAYRVLDSIDLSDQELLRRARSDVARVYPALGGVAPRHSVVQRHREVFTRFAPGEEARRPGAESGVDGLHLGGDWTAASHDAWMMERAVRSGLAAANAVLARRRADPFPIEDLGPEHWLLRVSRRAARVIRDHLLPDPTR